MLKTGIRVIEKQDLYYIAESKNAVRPFKPWIRDSFSFLYDFIMKGSIFPKKFGADMSRHYEILAQRLRGIHGKRVLELATGTGSAINFLDKDNQYTGTDISPGLLRKAVKNFKTAGFKDAKFYVSSADNLPFDVNIFNICLCILSLNFFDNVRNVFQEIRRVLVAGGVFICTVPVPERNSLQSTIRGTLYSEDELRKICQENGFEFESMPDQNGTLLYFTAISQ